VETASHTREEHVGELRLGVRAPTLPALFMEAGRGLAEVLVEDPIGTPRLDEKVSLRARDRDALLVAWLDELIFRAETRGRVYGAFRIDRLTDHVLEGAIGGQEPQTWRTAVKAATFHGLHIDEGPDGFSASVVLDV
jgi:SHS2 domain-containing protein